MSQVHNTADLVSAFLAKGGQITKAPMSSAFASKRRLEEAKKAFREAHPIPESKPYVPDEEAIQEELAAPRHHGGRVKTDRQYRRSMEATYNDYDRNN